MNYVISSINIKDNKYRYPMGWFIVEKDDDNGALHVN